MLMRINNLERNISKLMELKNTTQELREAYTSFNSQIDQEEERISEIEDQLNEIKREGKGRAWWLMPAIPALWEAGVTGSFEVMSLRPA